MLDFVILSFKGNTESVVCSKCCRMNLSLYAWRHRYISYSFYFIKVIQIKDALWLDCPHFHICKVNRRIKIHKSCTFGLCGLRSVNWSSVDRCTRNFSARGLFDRDISCFCTCSSAGLTLKRVKHCWGSYVEEKRNSWRSVPFYIWIVKCAS